MFDLMAATALPEKEQYQQLMNCLEEIQRRDPAMIRVDPYKGIEAASPDDPEIAGILTGDDEVIFCFGAEGVYLSCRSSDIIRQEESILLMRPGVLFKLGEDDNYASFSEQEVLEVIRHYADTLGQFRAGMCCIPVLRMTCDDQPEGR